MPNAALQVMSDEDLRRLHLPLQEASALPPAAYLDPAFFDLEQSRIFRNTWMAVCFTHDIPRHGDALPASVAGVNVIVVRDQNNEIQALHNVCRHRAATVLAEPAQGLNSFRCPYHCWTYHLDGSLKRAPFFDGTANGQKLHLDPQENGLVRIRSATWQNVVFVNISGTASPIEEHVAPLAERFKNYELDTLKHYCCDQNTIPANWKIVLEGLIEVYHENFIHRDLTYRMVKEGVPCWQDIVEGEMMGFVSTMPAIEGQVEESKLPRISGMPATGPAPSEIFLLFPSASFNVFEDHFVSTIWSPSAIKETSWRSAWYFHADAESGTGKSDPRNEVHDFWRNVRNEDLVAVKAVQQGMESLAAVPHDIRYSPFWEEILQKFHQHVVRAMA